MHTKELNNRYKNAARLLKQGSIGVLATDTIYGLVGSALTPGTIERMYAIRRSEKGKPFLLLISNISELGTFNIALDVKTKNFLEMYWPGTVSVVLPCDDPRFEYLSMSKKSIVFRIPAKKDLRDLLEVTGPLAAPSANLPSFPPAKTIKEAKVYFGNSIDFYIDEGEVVGAPSTLVKINDNGDVIVLRQGEQEIDSGYL